MEIQTSLIESSHFFELYLHKNTVQALLLYL